MMSLKDKLRELQAASARTGGQAVPEATFAGSQIPVRFQQDKSNSILVRIKRYPLQFCYGNQSLDELYLLDSFALSFMTGVSGFENLTAKDLLFVDTETTGLSGGTGTYVFLIGVGRVYENEFVVKQLLMNDFCHETELLETFLDELTAAKCLVTFNGKSFDIPLLRTRLLINRKETTALDSLPHIDLLVPTRRLWKRNLPSCSLSEVETNILNFRRVNDLPGWAVPQTYFTYLRSQDFQEILPVLRHNVQDILSLAALSAYLGKIAKKRASPSNANLLWLFRIYCQTGRQDEALGLSIEKPLFREEAEPEHERLLLEKAFLLKRLHRFHESNALLEELLNSARFGRIACAELAKFYEHKAKDHRKALELMIQFEKRCEIRALINGQSQISIDADFEWERRKQRLRQKIQYKKIDSSS